MADRIDRGRCIREAVCIDTKRVYDSCRDRDCIRDVRVFFPRCVQPIIDKAVNVKARSVELIWVDIDVEPVSFNRGSYQVSVRYYFKICFDVFTGMGQSTNVCGMAAYDKTAILFGSEGSSKVFTSKDRAKACGDEPVRSTNLPEACVEVVDPIVLQAKIMETCNCGRRVCGCGIDIESVPKGVCCCFDDEFVLDCEKRIHVTIGIFTIIRLCRNVQLLIPIYDFCIPQKECDCGVDDDPCELFSRFRFPLEEFFPPNRSEFEDTMTCG